MSGDVFAEFERAGWERAASRYEECWTDTVLFVEAPEHRSVPRRCGCAARG